MISTEGRKSSFYHQPVMPDEVLSYLITNQDGTYLDMTCGGGGHLKILSENLSERAILFGFDRDKEAVATALDTLKGVPQMTSIINSKFSEVGRMAGEKNINGVNGVLFDFGVSSHQINSSRRGFSFMQDGPLDMRMNSSDELTAETVINKYSTDRLLDIFRTYGEQRNARRIVNAIDKKRQTEKIDTTHKLQSVLKSSVSGKDLNSTLARLFQAIRIEVNGELDELKTALPATFDLLAPRGRLVCMSYHSLEDRIVKRFFQKLAKGCVCPDKLPVCVCGKKPEVEILTRRVVRPKKEEIEANSRARSARLRAAEKLI
ncbi:MAG: 16S rRNA (cytosine(1402)-N(4))-methyltransferase RsmH [candidate division Zixibacteria bacterium]|nr:16S rRNA (cytosine(1402)-N(4))-methyltransferase RsmH [candidate division Zixibacteria bacterium]